MAEGTLFLIVLGVMGIVLVWAVINDAKPEAEGGLWLLKMRGAQPPSAQTRPDPTET